MPKLDFSLPHSLDNDDLGNRIKSIRKEQGLTLVKLSEKSGVSRAALSKIERGEISPSYTTLRKIGFGLDLTIAALISSNTIKSQFDIEVVRADAGQVFDEEYDGYRLLAGKAIGNAVQCFVNEVRSQSPVSSDAFHVHNTKEIVFVLHGSVICHFKGHSPVHLNTGDSLFYPGNIPHAFTRGTRHKIRNMFKQYSA